jgi:hypothetical protein
MDILITLGMWLLILTFCAAGAWGLYYVIRMKVRYYKSLYAEAKTYFKKDNQ